MGIDGHVLQDAAFPVGGESFAERRDIEHGEFQMLGEIDGEKTGGEIHRWCRAGAG